MSRARPVRPAGGHSQPLLFFPASMIFPRTKPHRNRTTVRSSAAGELLLANRVDQRMSGSKIEQVVNRIRVSEPGARHGAVPRAPSIPKSVLTARETAAATKHRRATAADSGSNTDLPDVPEPQQRRRTQKDEQEEAGGAGVYSLPLQHHWSLKQPEWVHDVIPEIMDGKNILDYVDPEIDERLR